MQPLRTHTLSQARAHERTYEDKPTGDNAATPQDSHFVPPSAVGGTSAGAVAVGNPAYTPSASNPSVEGP